ncbi:MAG: beta-lactamase family protein [Halanaerobiales bacterium]|nr:beta-lactamase family protein [Halanaerobiales bacterium]
MKKITILFLLSVLILSYTSMVSAKFDNYKKLEVELSEIVNKPKYQLSGLQVLVVKDKETEYMGNFGYRHIDNINSVNNLLVNEDTKFRIASISKLITAIGIMQQVENGNLDLDKDIGEYFSFDLRNPNYPDDKITIKMLMSHTSSIRDGSFYSISPEDSIKEFFLRDGKYYYEGEHWAESKEDKSTKDKSPGKYFKYSNLNYGVLATILEKVTETRFDLYMKNNIFEPMNIEASYNIADFSKNDRKNVSTLYRKQINGKWNHDGPWIPQVDDYSEKNIDKNEVMISNPDTKKGYDFVKLNNYKIGTNGTIFSPQGGLRISAKDLGKIMKMFLNKGRYKEVQILKESSIELMFSPYWTYDNSLENGDNYWGLMTSYGLGTHIIRNVDGDRILENKDIYMSGHLGDAYGLLSGFMLDFDSNNGFIYLIGGVGNDPNNYFGEYSTFYKWEEEIMTAIFRNVFPNYK